MTSEKVSVKNVQGIVFSLMASSIWIILGLATGGPQAGGPSVTSVVVLLAIASVILGPSCARRYKWSYPAAIVIGVITLLSGAFGVITMGSVRGPAAGSFGPGVWTIIQIPVIYFAYRAYKESK